MLKVFKVDNAEGISKYKSLLATFTNVEPYYLLEYLEIFSGGLKHLICFSYMSENSEAAILMPGYVKPIVILEEHTGSFDFISPYGYTGPLFGIETNKEDLKQFWKETEQWYKENNVITEFVRFNLNDNNMCYSGDVVPTMLNIKGAIIDEGVQWKAFEHKVRKNVNKALRENLTCFVYYGKIPLNKIVEFYDIYIATMVRTNAKESFMYSLENFTKFISTNSSYVAICTIYFEDTPVSSELLLVSHDSIYSFLGGTDENFFDKRPNDFLKIQAINWARNNGKKYYVLGGGYGFEDGIFKYKKTFFPDDVVNYYTGRKIIDGEKYLYLVNLYNNARFAQGLDMANSEKTNFFPLYNMPMENLDRAI